MTDVALSNGGIPIKLHACVSWSSFMEFARREAIAESILFILDEDGILDTAELSAGAPEILALGTSEVWLIRGPKSDEVERAFDAAIIAMEAAGKAWYTSLTIITGILPDNDDIVVFAVRDDILKEMGTLRSVMIGLFSEKLAVANARMATLTSALQAEILKDEDGEDE